MRTPKLTFGDWCGDVGDACVPPESQTPNTSHKLCEDRSGSRLGRARARISSWLFRFGAATVTSGRLEKDISKQFKTTFISPLTFWLYIWYI